jgi:DNA-binding winged helix-turn-helix (wHTH) protein
MTVRFGDLLFDEEARELRRGGATVALSPKAFQLLEALLEACPRVLSRPELQDRLWPDTHVTHTSLPRVVNELRQALGDDPKEPRYVRTVHGYGYAFKAQALGSDDSPQPGEGEAGSGRAAPLVPFNLLWGGRQIALVEGDTVIGRDPDCGVRIDSPKVSRRHARIRVQGLSATIEDLGSKNGTKIGSRPVEEVTPLSDGDEIVIGPATLLFWATGGGSTETAVHDEDA